MFMFSMRVLGIAILFSSLVDGISVEQRRKVVQSFNVHRNASSEITPLQVGNGNFAFGVDITGLQTFKPYGILSTWCWHNFSLPTTPGQTRIEDFTGVQWWTHDRLVTYSQPNPEQPELSQWLRENPHRLNMGRIGFDFGTQHVTEADLEQKNQTLDMWSGQISSTFLYNDTLVSIKTWADPDSDTVAISLSSLLFINGLGLFLDFPYPDHEKFNAPFVGVYNQTALHTTTLSQLNASTATITHTLDNTTYLTTITSTSPITLTRPNPLTHRYHLLPTSPSLNLTLSFSPAPITPPSALTITESSTTWWNTFWHTTYFVDLTSTPLPAARELQRRILTSLYLTTLNSASTLPPQESGLVNNGWHGKFHLEMTLWHMLPFLRWNHTSLFSRCIPSVYERFLPSSVQRAREQGYKGARWGKMSDPQGRSAPGEINSLLIWQQPHVMYFAEMEYRQSGDQETLAKWDALVGQTAEWMVDFAWWDGEKERYVLGPPVYPVSENTNPNATVNPAFELAYWRFGLDVAVRWRERMGKEVPPKWEEVRKGLAELPVVEGTYAVYEGIEGMWTREETTWDHPAMAGVYGLLPPTEGVEVDVVRRTALKIRDLWRLEESYGWDFAMLAMNELRLGNVEQAVEYLLHPVYQFDDAGYPVGGSRVPTPYFPNSASLLVAVAMMAGGWDGSEGKHFPEGWVVDVEGFTPAL